MKRNAFAITFLFAAFLLTGTPVIVLSSCSNAEQPEPTPNPEPDPPAPSKDLLPSYALFESALKTLFFQIAEKSDFAGQF